MYYEVEIYGCAFGCPLQIREKDCPFNEVEHLTNKEKVNWMKSLTEKDKEAIVKHHLYCTKRKKEHNQI